MRNCNFSPPVKETTLSVKLRFPVEEKEQKNNGLHLEYNYDDEAKTFAFCPCVWLRG